MSDDIISKINQLETLMKEIYGCGFDAFLEKMIERSFDQGLKKGYRLGKSDGRRVAKGLEEIPKKRGRPMAMDRGFAVLMVKHVRERRAESNLTIKEAVNEFLEIMKKGIKKFGLLKISNQTRTCDDSKVSRLPNLEQAVATYHRAQANDTFGSWEKMFTPDDALRERIRRLK